jgi:Condensation domain
MSDNSNMVAEASVRQLEFLKYVPAVMTFDSEMSNVNIDALEKTVAFFVRRHESVRTVFPLINGKVKQLILPCDDKRFLVKHIDISHSDKQYSDVRNHYFKRTEVEFVNKHRGPLTKFLLFKVAENKHVFLLLIDHIICDGWSLEKIIKEELIMFYTQYSAGREPVIKPLKAQLKDYCEHQKIWLEKEKGILSRFWKTKLSGYDDRFDVNSVYRTYLSRNKDAFATRANYMIDTQRRFLELYGHPLAHVYTFTITGQRFAAAKRMCEKNNCTLSSLIYAGLYILFHYYTDKKRILMAAFIADRFIPSNRLIIGLLLGTVYFPREIADNTTILSFVDETMQDVLTNCQNIIFNHDLLDLDEKKLNLRFDVLVNYIKSTTTPPQVAAQTGKHFDTLGSPYYLESMVYEYDDGFVFHWKYKRFFDKKIIEDMVKCYNTIIDLTVENSTKTIADIKNNLNAEIP